MNYKLTLDPSIVLRLPDKIWIPIGHRWWSDYQKWLAAGNTPDPADPTPPPIDFSNLDNIEKGLKALALCVAQVGGLTNAQMKAMFKAKWDLLP